MWFSMEVTAFPGRMQEFLINQAAERLIISPNARGVGKKSLWGTELLRGRGFRNKRQNGCSGQGISILLFARHHVRLQHGIRAA